MIEVVSHPSDLSSWDPEADPFYFEVYGETEPLLDMTYAEVLPAGGGDAATTTAGPVYEYWWTIGHAGSPPLRRRWPQRNPKMPIWSDLRDPAARVYLYFPLHGGWRIKELVATVKYLSPVKDEKSWSSNAADDWAKLQPMMEDAGTLASKLGVVPGVGAVAAGAAPILSTLAKLKVGSVPQGKKGFDWSVRKVTTSSKEHHQVVQGVMWTLPKPMFQLLGGRLTGSLAVSFIPSRAQDPVAAAWEPRPAQLMGHAVVLAKGGKHWAPASNKFVELTLAPQVPNTSTAPPPRDSPPN